MYLGMASSVPRMSLALIAAMFCLPMITAYHQVPIPNFYGEWIAALCGLLALSPLLTKHFWQSSIPRASFIFLGLLLTIQLQMLFQMHPASPNVSLIEAYVSWAFFLTLLGWHLRKSLGLKSVVTTLAWALVLAAAINSVFVVLQLLLQFEILQTLNLAKLIPHLTSYGMLGQSNHFANITALAMCSLIYLYSRHACNRTWLIIGLLTGLCLLSLSGSRSSLLYLIAIAMLCWVRQRQPSSETESPDTAITLFRLSLILIPTFVILQIVLTTFLPQAFIHTPVARAMEAVINPSASLRWQFWQTSLALFNQSPLLGMGIGQIRWQTFVTADLPTINHAHMFFEHAHNLFLHLLTEVGLVGLIIVFAGLILWILPFFKQRSRDPETIWLLGILAILGIHSQLEYPLWYSYFLGICAFLLGVGEFSEIKLSHLSNAAKASLKLTFAAAFIYGLVQLTLMQIAYQKLERQIHIASQTEMSSSEKQTLVEEMLWVSDHSLLSPYGDLVLATYLVPNTAQADIQLSIAERAAQFIPLRRPCLNLVVLLEMNHRHPEALQLLRSLRRMAGDRLEQDIAQLPADNLALLNALLLQADTPPLKRSL
ncbi:PglL family O-oligosaccharyltransferase [Methylophilus medardicus]|uniref:Uncharacterized protein n=1 Tax=Methylophilus medardicus TaxID=2588534 RepID=A0A5B8CQ98_9PROT|nr:Wzy polymerase domain-containing protein [Methylophilus medardicus]QDC43423.1 hypothetical protein FIU01_02040 [Methylophilus medardicus]QDC48430.1 hypothetical protein FIU00_02040 [Methylophilus medardicus]QDC52135.1 hypothetical protein FIT99_02040 [Methylophilus medardicus]